MVSVVYSNHSNYSNQIHEEDYSFKMNHGVRQSVDISRIDSNFDESYIRKMSMTFRKSK